MGEKKLSEEGLADGFPDLLLGCLRILEYYLYFRRENSS